MAGVALLQVDAVALVGLHDPGALRTEQGVGDPGEDDGGFGGSYGGMLMLCPTAEHPGKCLGVRPGFRRAGIGLDARGLTPRSHSIRANRAAARCDRYRRGRVDRIPGTGIGDPRQRMKSARAADGRYRDCQKKSIGWASGRILARLAVPAAGFCGEGHETGQVTGLRAVALDGGLPGENVKDDLAHAAVGRAQASPDLGHPVRGGCDLDVPIDVGRPGHSHRLGVEIDRRPVDELGDLVPGPGVPLMVPGGPAIRRCGQVRRRR